MKKLLYVLILFIPVVSSSQFSQDVDFLDVKLLSAYDKVKPGMTLDLAVQIDIKEEYHINSHLPEDEFLIPTELKLDTHSDITINNIQYPEHEYKKFSFSEKKLAIYESNVNIFVTLMIPPDISMADLKISGELSYQPCNDQMCFAPGTESFSKLIPVVSLDAKVQEQHQTIFKNRETAVDDVSSSPDFTSDELKAKEILEKGIWYAFAAFFVVGLALNLTPCVYPVIPLTVSYFGGQKEKAKSSFLNAFIYLIGIAISFSILGLVSGLAGKQWGFLFTSPWFVVIISMIILSMAASLFGAFEITVPSWLLTKVGKSQQGFLGALLMGLTVGVVIAPCAAGIIIGLVGLVAKLGLVVKGTLLFFVMGIGLGLPYLVLATFSGLLNKLPQSGTWMIWVKKLFGMMLIGVAVYFLIPQVERIYDKLGFLLGIVTVFTGLLLGFLDQTLMYSKKFKISRSIFGILVIILGGIWINGSIHATKSDITWIYLTEQPIEQVIDPEKPTFIDFYADWCAPCKQLDRTTFSDPRVAEKSKKLNMVKVDCTTPNKQIQNTMNKYNVTGMPTLVFLDRSMNEKSSMREIGYIDADTFLNKMDTLLEKK